MSEEFESSLKIKVVPSTRFEFAFGKYEIYAGVPTKPFNEELKKRGIIPFTKERCGVVNHVYFFGKVDKIKEACKKLDEQPDIIFCGIVHKGEIGSPGCYPEELT